MTKINSIRLSRALALGAVLLLGMFVLVIANKNTALLTQLIEPQGGSCQSNDEKRIRTEQFIASTIGSQGLAGRLSEEQIATWNVHVDDQCRVTVGWWTYDPMTKQWNWTKLPFADPVELAYGLQVCMASSNNICEGDGGFCENMVPSIVSLPNEHPECRLRDGTAQGSDLYWEYAFADPATRQEMLDQAMTEYRQRLQQQEDEFKLSMGLPCNNLWGDTILDERCGVTKPYIPTGVVDHEKNAEVGDPVAPGLPGLPMVVPEEKPGSLDSQPPFQINNDFQMNSDSVFLSLDWNEGVEE